jgi:beta-ribofuranosylaminobenzene 5'-phosphate synthase
LLVRPDVAAGRSGEEEDVSMREVVEAADPGVADRIAGVLTRRLLPAAATGDLDEFGDALTKISRLNGVWYADEQGGVFRPPVGTIVDALADSTAVVGAGQSSWGPTAFGLTDRTEASEARTAGYAALDAAGVDGTVSVVEFADAGARIGDTAGSDK